MAKPTLAPRAACFNRFQTATFGSYVPTAVDAHFDPFLEPVKRPRLSNDEMERVAKVVIPQDPTTSR